MANVIFEDLEIDFSDMLTNPEGFAERVYEKAEELKAICKADTSVKSFEERYKAQGTETPSEITDFINNYYDAVDDADLSIMVDAIKKAKKLVTDLETAFRDRCIRQAATEGTNIGNKRVAHAQYTRLKDDFNLFVKSFKMFSFASDIDLKPLPNLPGNYGSGNVSLIYYVFELNGDQYRNHYAVSRKVGIESMNLMDTVEYFNAHPELGVKVTEVN